MLVITLLCNLGMSTSMLIESITKAGKARNIQVDIEALPFDKASERLKKTEILLLGPQVRYLLPKFQKEHGNEIKVISTINMTDYALINGDGILTQALSQLKESNEKR